MRDDDDWMMTPDDVSSDCLMSVVLALNKFGTLCQFIADCERFSFLTQQIKIYVQNQQYI